MKAVLMFFLILGSYSVSAQTIKFKISGQEDDTVNLVRYFGQKLFYADTAVIKKGVVEFDGSKQDPGILALFLPGQQRLEFVYNGEKETYIEASMPDLMQTSVVKKSAENKLFLSYVQFISKKRQEANVLDANRKTKKPESDEYKALTEKIDAINKEVVDYQQNLADKPGDFLASKIVKMSMDIEVPDAPVDENGEVIDENFRFKYYRAHYFDNIDLQDERLMRTPVFHNKFVKYFSDQMMIQHWDTVIYYAFDFCDRLDQKSDMFQYCVSWITSNYEKSKIMGMNKVFVHMAKCYYCSKNADGESPAHWVPEKNLKTLCEKADTHMDLVMGAKPPNIRLRDTTDVNWKGFYELDSEYTILYFWDPNCGHCKKITPKLQTLYSKKWKERNIEVFSVCKAAGEDFQLWKDFIKKNNLEFTNVAITDKMLRDAQDKSNNQAKLQVMLRETTIESLNYQQTYDIYATPKVWVLDKDKKIIAYSLTVSQLEDLMDRLQEKTDTEKLFPPTKDEEDEKMH